MRAMGEFRNRRYTNPSIDLGLAVLAAMFPGRPLSLREIAEACNCTTENIRKIEVRALRRARELLHERGCFRECQEAWKGSVL